MFVVNEYLHRIVPVVNLDVLRVEIIHSHCNLNQSIEIITLLIVLRDEWELRFNVDLLVKIQVSNENHDRYFLSEYCLFMVVSQYFKFISFAFLIFHCHICELLFRKWF